MLKYFAYGSNLLHSRLRARVSTLRVITVATLNAHRLMFHKIGTDDSGKCDAFYTGDPKDQIHGVVYGLDPSGKDKLDQIEGVGSGYEIKQVQVTQEGTCLSVFTYVVQDAYIDPEMKPYHWYKHFVVAGARQNDFPEAYIAALEKIDAIPDRDHERRQENRLIAEQSGPDIIHKPMRLRKGR